MNDALTSVGTLNEQLDELLSSDEPDWEHCVKLASERDKLIADAAVQGVSAHEIKRSLEVNDLIEQKMKAEQAEIERALIKVNQGKKARASYE